MQSFYAQAEDVFNDLYKVDHALFYNFPNGIRFGLSDLGENINDGTVTEQFYRSLTRCIELYRFIFDDEKVYINLRFFHTKKSINANKAFKSLKDCGFSLNENDFEYSLKQGDEDNFVHQYAFTTNEYNSEVHALLWLACAKDLGQVSPPERSRKRTYYPEIYFMNLDKGIIFHPYDDRGADLVSIDKEEIRPVYNKFYDWILDYDLELITEKFGKPETL